MHNIWAIETFNMYIPEGEVKKREYIRSLKNAGIIMQLTASTNFKLERANKIPGSSIMLENFALPNGNHLTLYKYNRKLPRS